MRHDTGNNSGPATTTSQSGRGSMVPPTSRESTPQDPYPQPQSGRDSGASSSRHLYPPSSSRDDRSSNTEHPSGSHIELESNLALAPNSPNRNTDVEANHLDHEPSKVIDVSPRSIIKQVIFVFTCISAQWMAQAQLGMIIIPLYQVGSQVGTQNVGQLSWMAAAYGYVTSLRM